jgi:hypothetical protein
MFSHYHVLWCLVCCWGWFCLSALVHFTVWLPCLLGYFIHFLVPVCKMLFAIHIAPYRFSYFSFCLRPSVFQLCIFRCILGQVALTVSEWSVLSCLDAVTLLSLSSTRFPITPDVSIITPRIMALAEKLTGFELVKNSPAFYATFYAQQLPICPDPEPDQASPLLPNRFLRSILILSSHLRLGLSSGLFPWVFALIIMIKITIIDGFERCVILFLTFLFLWRIYV